ncbi:MAG TPA: primosomal protein N', partial [Anaerolineae bacterium]
VVLARRDTSPVETTRDVLEIVDPVPFISPVQLDLARWIADEFLAMLSDAVWLFLPPGIEQKFETLLSVAPDAEEQNLNDKQRGLVEMIRQAGELRLARVPPQYRSQVESLTRAGLLQRRSQLTAPRSKPKQVRAVRLLMSPDQALSTLDQDTRGTRAQKRRAIVEFLAREPGPVWLSALYAATDSNLADLHKLDERGIVALEEEEVIRDPLAGKTFEPGVPPPLTGEQAGVLAPILSALAHAAAPLPGDSNPAANTFLLHGVTGAGKTEIYLRACAESLARGKQAIVLVPEIALTPQTIARFGARFGNRIGVIHSDLSAGERFDTWRRARAGEIDIIIGPRSALFAPLQKLGLIVIDEEHEPSYKQDSPALHVPSLHARTVAREYARRTGATLILGSATPDVETYFRARRGEISLLELPRRIETALEPSPQRGAGEETRFAELPPVTVVDMREELKQDNRSIFSRALRAALTTTLDARQQAILFLNRRGTATFVMCRNCGHVLKCPRCGNPFTYHGSANALVCHHCNKRGTIPTRCPNCGSTRIRYFGTGTERIESEVRELFRGARVLRWDADATREKGSHDEILAAFLRHDADVLIGTQMIAKGLDMPRVTLVGVISADTALGLPDFRAGERTFQLLVQVAGRAGRSALGGQVIVQTYQPEHYAIRAAAHHDYSSFYETEIKYRRELNYPPFARLVRLVYAGRSEQVALNESLRLARALGDRIRQRGLLNLDLIGPAPAFYNKLRGAWRYHLLVRGQDPHALLADLPLPAEWRVDVDPVSLL